MGKTYKMNAITGELDLVENLEEINAALERGILKSVDVSGENMIFTFNTSDLAPVTVPLSHFATNLQGHAYIGLATPSTTPVTLKGNEKVFYIVTEEGDYSNFGVGNISELSIIKSENGRWKAENFRLKFLSLNGGRMIGNIDMNGKRVDNVGIEEVDKLPTFNLYEGRMVKFKNKTYTFYNGLWLALSDDLRGHANDTHEENFVYQPTASDLSVKDGFADIKKLKGNTVVWNQKFINEAFINNGVNITTSEDALILNGTLNTTYLGITNASLNITKIPLNHIGYYRIVIVKDNSNILQNKLFGLLNRGKHITITQNTAKFLYQNTNDSQGWGFGISKFSGGEVFEDVQIKANVFDLTQMFGEGNEPATVEEFEAMFPNEYYEYNEGELLSFDGKGVKSVGFNQWDEEWEPGKLNTITGNNLEDTTKARSKNYIKVFPSTKYYFKSPTGTNSSSVWIALYDKNYNIIQGYNGSGLQTNGNMFNIVLALDRNREFTTSPNAAYMRFYMSTEFNHDICINLVHSGYRNGEYEKYEDYTLSFQDGNTISQLTGKLNGEGDSVVIFPDGLRSAGTVYDEIVYDEATGKHKAIKRIGSVDMGTLSWNKYSDITSYYTEISKINNFLKIPEPNKFANILSSEYRTYKYTTLYNDININGISSYNTIIKLNSSSYTDANSFKASLQGQILYYELETPEVYELDFPINTSYEAYDFGTEEVLYSDDKEVNIPMKANIEYGFNAVDMIRNNFEEIRSLKERVIALEQAILQIQTANIAIE